MEKKQITKCIEYYIDSRTCKNINDEINNIQEIKDKPANREIKYEYKLNDFGVYEVKVYFIQNKIDWGKTFEKVENSSNDIIKSNDNNSLVTKGILGMLIVNTKRTLSTTIYNLKETLSKTFISIGRTFSKYNLKFKIYLTPDQKLSIYSGENKYGKYKDTKKVYKPY